jgi:hypothetical protein
MDLWWFRRGALGSSVLVDVPTNLGAYVLSQCGFTVQVVVIGGGGAVGRARRRISGLMRDAGRVWGVGMGNVCPTVTMCVCDVGGGGIVPRVVKAYEVERGVCEDGSVILGVCRPEEVCSVAKVTVVLVDEEADEPDVGWRQAFVERVTKTGWSTSTMQDVGLLNLRQHLCVRGILVWLVPSLRVFRQVALLSEHVQTAVEEVTQLPTVVSVCVAMAVAKGIAARVCMCAPDTVQVCGGGGGGGGGVGGGGGGGGGDGLCRHIIRRRRLCGDGGDETKEEGEEEEEEEEDL